MSLIELMVSMILLSAVLTILTAASISALRSSTGANVRAQNASTARVAMDRVTKELRQSIKPNADVNVVTAATATSVSFYSEIGTFAVGATTASSGPTGITISLGNDAKLCPSPDYCLLESDTPTTLGTDSTGNAAWVPGATSSTKVLVHYVNTAATTQLFTYYQTQLGGSNPAAPTRTTVLLPLVSGSLSTASLAAVDTVDVYLSVKDPSTPSAPATSIDERVSFPNVSPYAKVAPVS